MSEGLYFRQLLSGRDFATGDEVARAMRNFTYLVGDRRSGEALVVDPAYDVAELVAVAAEDGVRLVGAVATHFHPDHVGGTMMGHRLEGILELHRRLGVPIHAHAAEVPWLLQSTGVAHDALRAHADGDVLHVGEVGVTLLHTPGHTPGGQCLLVEQRLLSGDTLFIEGCGRTDLPGGDEHELFVTLQERLRAIDDDVVLYPGHLYSEEPSLPMGQVRARNAVLSMDGGPGRAPDS